MIGPDARPQRWTFRDIKEVAYGPLEMTPETLGRMTPAAFFEYMTIRADYLAEMAGAPGQAMRHATHALPTQQHSGETMYDRLRRQGHHVFE